MPRTKPQRDQARRPASRDRLGRHRRRRRGQGRAARGRRVPARPEALPARSARRCPKGILLHGPPGTGKTLLAKAVAHESGAQFFAQSAVVVRRDVRRPRRRAHPAPVREARKHAPAIIFIDELDAVGGAPRLGQHSASATRRSTSCWSRWTASPPRGDVVVIAASNLLEKLDPALLRPGRFDRQVFVSPPDVARPRARSSRCTRATSRWARTSTSSSIARQTARPDRRRPGQHLQRGGDLRARRERRTRSRRRDFDERARARRRRRAVAHARSTSTRGASSPTTRPATRCARELLPGVDRVHKISIVPRGQRARLHAEPARRGPLPEDARGADRLHDGAARRPRGRADRLRRGHHRRLRRPRSAWPRSPTRWSTSTRWAPAIASRSVAPTATPCRTDARASATRSSSELADEAHRARAAS